MTLRAGIFTAVALAAPGVAQAQSAPAQRAAATITETDVRRRINIVADDSMGGRNTPSPGLTKTAQYVANEFKRFGLKPGGDSGSWFRNYPIAQKKILVDQSFLRFAQISGDRGVRLTLAEGVAWAGRRPTIGAGKGGVVLVGGSGRVDSLPLSEFPNRVIVYLTDWSVPGAATRFGQLARIASDARAKGIVAVINSDSAFTAAYGSVNSREFQTVGDASTDFFNVVVRQSAVETQLPEAADQFDALRGAPSVQVQPMLDWEGEASIADTTLGLQYAPNTVGILEGSDPVLKHEYLVFSAHMDHVGTSGQPGAGCRAVGADSVCNGADDDGSGTVAVLELAEAFTRAGVRPKRSMIFLTVSGEEHGLWGSQWFVNHPPVNITQIVADLNTDMIGRNWPDTIVAIGKQHSDLGSTLNRVNAAHPELKMVAIDDRWPAQRFYSRSDHYNFAKKGVPILFFFNGTHADYHQVSDSPDKIDAEKESRIVKLVYYVGLEVANAKQRPQWVPASYQQIVTP
jgi:hypothetical protein